MCGILQPVMGTCQGLGWGDPNGCICSVCVRNKDKQGNRGQPCMNEPLEALPSRNCSVESKVKQKNSQCHNCWCFPVYNTPPLAQAWQTF